MASSKIPEIDHEAKKAPLLGTWKKWYWVVICNLIVLIILFYIFSHIYS